MLKYCPGAFDQSIRGWGGSLVVVRIGNSAFESRFPGVAKVKLSLPIENSNSSPAEYSTVFDPYAGVYNTR